MENTELLTDISTKAEPPYRRGEPVTITLAVSTGASVYERDADQRIKSITFKSPSRMVLEATCLMAEGRESDLDILVGRFWAGLFDDAR